MAEGGSSKRPSASGIINLIMPSPSLQAVMFWQGIVEIVARIVLLVLLLILFATSSAAEDQTSDYSDFDKANDAQAAAGFAIFMGVITFIFEILFIVCRFLNFMFMTSHRTIFLMVDIIFHAVCALLLFAAAVSLAYHADYAKNLADDLSKIDPSNLDPSIDPDIVDTVIDILNRIGNTLGAAAFFAFMSLFTMIFIAVWSILYVVFKWDLGGSGKSSSSTSAS